MMTGGMLSAKFAASPQISFVIAAAIQKASLCI